MKYDIRTEDEVSTPEPAVVLWLAADEDGDVWLRSRVGTEITSLILLTESGELHLCEGIDPSLGFNVDKHGKLRVFK